jgi:hypothetical protein
MRAVAIGLLWLYGAANVVAGTADLLAQHSLPVTIALGLIVSGALLAAAGVLTARGSPHALLVTLISVALAFALALFNERVLGLGHPSHHIGRGLLTAVIVWSVWRGRSQPVQSN